MEGHCRSVRKRNLRPSAWLTAGGCVSGLLQAESAALQAAGQAVDGVEQGLALLDQARGLLRIDLLAVEFGRIEQGQHLAGQRVALGGEAGELALQAGVLAV